MTIQKDWLVRALKTFAQAFIAVIIAQMASTATNIATFGWDELKTYLTPVIIAALSAGVSAVWNLILEDSAKKKAQLEASLSNVAAEITNDKSEEK